MKTVIYFDMDGTCNHWDLQGNPYEEHYFLHREPFPNVLSAVRQLKEMGVARILSSISLRARYSVRSPICKIL